MERVKVYMKQNNIRPELTSDRESWGNMMKNNIHPEWTSDRESWGNMMKNAQPYPGNDGKVRKKASSNVDAS